MEETDQTTNVYNYDVANRMTSVNGVAYSWSNNGNLLSDGFTSYSYDHANRLTGVVQDGDIYGYAYNGLGDRLVQTINGAPTTYTLDLNRGLTQVLADGSNAYLYGVNRIGELQPGGWAYHLPDALGSLRQIANGYGEIQLAQSFEPFGTAQIQGGAASSSFGFAGEWLDDTGLINLRARYYAPSSGIFISPDLWRGDDYQPMSHNAWLFVYANPINNIDPSGWCAEGNEDCMNIAYGLETRYGFRIHWPNRQDEGKSGPYPYGYWRRWLKLDCDEENRAFTHFLTNDLNRISESLVYIENAIGYPNTLALVYGGVLFKTPTLDTSNDTIAIYCPEGDCRNVLNDSLDFNGAPYSIGFDYDWSANTESEMVRTVLHEFGHRTHAKINSYGRTSILIHDALAAIWRDFGAPTNRAAALNNKEYFADVFAMYVWEANNLYMTQGEMRSGATSLFEILEPSGYSLHEYFENDVLPLIRGVSHGK